MAQANKGEIVLGYWAIRGLAEPIRLALHYAKKPYTEKMYEQGEGPEFNGDSWLSEKQKLGLDFPNLPYLICDDLKITQSKAILYYVGRKLDLMGKNPIEEANVMMLCEEAHDLRMKLGNIFYGPDGASAEERRKVAETTLAEYLKKFDTYLGKRNTKFAAGDQPTVADFQLYEYVDSGLVLDGADAVLEKLPNLKKFLAKIRDLPEIKDYITKAHSKLPINNKIATYGGKIIERK